MPDIDNLISMIYPDGNPSWATEGSNIRNKQIRLEYDRLVKSFGLQKNTSRLILARLIGRGPDAIKAILYRR